MTKDSTQETQTEQGSRRPVFLSYASQDAEAAHRICHALRAAGIEVWFDQSELRGGDAWDRKIRTQIRDCALFIPIISAHSEARLEGYFRREWKWAVDRTQDMADQKPFLVPVVIDDTAERGASTPEKFHEVQWTRLPNGATSSAFIDRVVGLLSRSEPWARTSTGKTERGGETGGVSKALTSNPAGLRRLPVALMLLAVCGVFAIGYLLIDRLVLSKHPAETGRVPASAMPSVPAVQTAVSEKSIAVLPFLDMSEKHDQEYFSDGLAEELLDQLAKTPGLHVIARTSSFYFKGKQVALAEIGRTLNVASILEGSVRKSGNRLRVTTQLIRTDTGEPLWSETYERDLKDVFQVQDEIAAGVVQSLKAKLLPAASRDRIANLTAYALLLQGRFLNARASEADLRQAIDVLRRAVTLEPTYASAWSELAQSYLWLSGNVDSDPVPNMESAHTAVQRALSLNPADAAAHYLLATVRIVYEHDWPRALAEIEAARRADPDLTTPVELVWVSGCNSGPCHEQYLHDISRDIERDPLNALALGDRGYNHYYAGELEAAEADIRRALEISPNIVDGRYLLGRVLMAREKLDEALSEFESLPDSLLRRQGLALAYHALGRKREADAALHNLLEKDSVDGPFQIAELYAARGDSSSAIDWLQRDYDQKMYGILDAKVDPLFKPLAHEPRFIELMNRFAPSQ